MSLYLYSRDLYPDLVVQAQVTPLTYSKRARSPVNYSQLNDGYSPTTQTSNKPPWVITSCIHVSHMCLLSYNHSRNADGLEQWNPRGQLRIVRARGFLHYNFYVLNHATCLLSRELVVQEKRASAENWKRYLKTKIQNQRSYVHTLRHHFTC